MYKKMSPGYPENIEVSTVVFLYGDSIFAIISKVGQTFKFFNESITPDKNCFKEELQIFF